MAPCLNLNAFFLPFAAQATQQFGPLTGVVRRLGVLAAVTRPRRALGDEGQHDLEELLAHALPTQA